MRNIIFSTLLCLACILAYVPSAIGEIIKVGAGAGAPTENILKPIKEPFEKSSSMQLSIISAGVKAAFQDVESGVVDAGAAGLSFEDWLLFMKKEGVDVKDSASFSHFKIGKDRIAVLTNKENAVEKLSKEQLQKIFAGEIDNWKDVGGADSIIIVVFGALQQGTNNTFTKQIMDGKPITKDNLGVYSAKDVLAAVASNPSAIGFGPGGVVDGSVKTPAIPEIARDITLITKGKPSAKVQKLIDYIMGEGKQFIRQ